MSTQNDPLVLTGTQSNATQLEVTAHAPQDYPIQTWRVGGGAVAQISQDGRLEVGDQAVASSSPPALVEANQSINASSVVTQGLQTRGIVSGAGAINQPLTWSQHELEMGGTGGVSGTHQALRGIVTQNNTGSSTGAEMRAASFEVKNNQTLGKAVAVRAEITNASGGNLTEAAAFEAVMPSAGTIGTLYGLRIPDLPSGTNRFAIHTGAGAVRFGGPVALNGTPEFHLQGLHNSYRSVFFSTTVSGVNKLRWSIYTDGSGESSGNAGSNLFISRYDDNGNKLQNDVLSINRSTGAILTPTEVTIYVLGTLYKGAGNFLIDHPLDPTNRNLIHSFVEGPKADLIYRGEVTLSNGRASVSIDATNRMSVGTFEALTRHAEAQVWIQNDTGWEPVRGRVVGGTLEIECKDPASTDTVSWLVVAERADPFIKHSTMTDEMGRLIVEVEKPTPTAEELKVLEPRIDEAVQEVHRELVSSLSGKRGYPFHPEAIGLTQPTREVRPLSRVAPTDEPM